MAVERVEDNDGENYIIDNEKYISLTHAKNFPKANIDCKELIVCEYCKYILLQNMK